MSLQFTPEKKNAGCLDVLGPRKLGSMVATNILSYFGVLIGEL